MLGIKESIIGAVADIRHLQPLDKAPQNLVYTFDGKPKIPDKNIYAGTEFVRDYTRRRSPLGILATGLMHAVGKEVEFRKDQLKAKVREKKRSPLHNFVRSELALHRDIDLANRMANQLVEELINKDHEFQEHFFASRENEEYSDHNVNHLRRVELFSKTFAVNTVDARVDLPINRFMPAVILADQFHDADQSLSIHKNHTMEKSIRMLFDDRTEEEIQTRLDETLVEVKKGHCEAGAVMTLAMYKDYAKVNGIPESEAWRICAEAAIMIVKHDKLEYFNTAIEATRDASDMTDDQLVQAYRAHDVDLFSISPRQLLHILKEEKKYKSQDGKYVNNDSPHGLAPAFEHFFKSTLLELANDNKKLFDSDRYQYPFDVNNDDFKKPFKVATQIFMFADTSDMTTPAIEGFFRSLKTQYSKERPFMTTLLTNEDRDELIDLITLSPLELANKKGWPIDDKKEVKKKRIELEKKYNTDTYRKLYESCHFVDPIEGSVLQKSKHIQRFTKDAALMNAIATRKFGLIIMEADDNSQYQEIQEAYKRRINGLRRKALEKRVIGFISDINLEDLSDAQIAERLDSYGDYRLARKYLEKATTIRSEMDEILQSFKSDKKKAAYTEQDRDNFKYICDEVIKFLRETHRVSNAEMTVYEEYIDSGELPTTLPYGRYDSLGSHTGTRKITSQSGVIFSLAEYFRRTLAV